MAAKIVPFPTDSRAAAPGALRAADGDAVLDLVIEFVNTDPPRTRTVSARTSASLAEVHLLIARLFGWEMRISRAAPAQWEQFG